MEKVALTDVEKVAHEVLARLLPKESGATIVVLQGELGAGKTTFTQALARVLGVTDPVQSPTYVLMKKYPIDYKGFHTLVHIDAYRLNVPQEFKTLHPESFLADPTALVVLEWPERVAGELPKPDCVMKFSSDNASENERYIEIV